METKFTPGPWIVDGPPYNQIVWSGTEDRVCFLAHSNGLDEERDIATGNLIAAAPDLYAAAMPIVARLNEIEEDRNIARASDDGVGVPVTIGLLRALRAALAKASDGGA